MTKEQVAVPTSDAAITVPQPANGGALIKDEGIVAVAREAEARVAALEKIIQASLRVTSEWDWVRMRSGGDDAEPRVYMTGSGAEKIARLFGIQWTFDSRERVEREDSNGPFYMWIITGTFRMGDQTIPEVGTCTSRDPFFAKRGQQYIPSHDVDEPSILKAAITNCVVRGVTGLIGLRNLPVSFLPDRIKGKVPEVNYQTGTQGGATGQDDDTRTRARELGNWLLEMHNGDAQAAMDELEQLTTWKKKKTDPKTGEVTEEEVKGRRDLKRLSAGQVGWLHDKIGKDYLKFKADMAARAAQAGADAPDSPRPDQAGQGDAAADPADRPLAEESWDMGGGDK